MRDIVAEKADGSDSPDLYEVYCQSETLAEIEQSCGIDSANDARGFCASLDKIKDAADTIETAANVVETANTVRKWYENIFLSALIVLTLIGALL